MKALIFKLILPLAVISFATISKWWYAIPVDAPDSLLIGFPFPYVCEGWHTSMSLQFFVLELILDFLLYFAVWVAIVYCIDRFLMKISLHKTLTMALWATAGIVVCCACLRLSFADPHWHAKRNFEMEILKTGYQFGLDWPERPVFIKPNKNETQ